jgi:asparaginyl-tRNA synthetase
MPLLEKLNFVANNFKRVSYTEAIDILKDCTPNKRKSSTISLTNGVVTIRVERYLVEKHFKCPVISLILINIKAFHTCDLKQGWKTQFNTMDITGMGGMGGSQRRKRLMFGQNKH